MKRSGYIQRSTPLRPVPSGGGRRKGIKPKKRTASEYNRIYGSKARVQWVKSLPCAVAGRMARLPSGDVVRTCCVGPIEGHHTINGGAGRKADADTITPLCMGHHHTLHNMGVASFGRRYGVDLKAEAARIAAEWLAHVEAA